MSEAPEVKFLRKRDDKFVYHATQKLLDRGDMFPCNEDGEFLTTNTVELKAPPQPETPKSDTSDGEDNSLVLAMIERAKELGIKNPHNMKEETLATRIAEAEAALSD